MFNDKFLLLAENIKDLGISCERLGIQYTSKLSTLEVTVSQQAIKIKKLQETVAGDLTTCSIEAWEIVDEQIEQIKKLQQRIEELEYTDTDEVLIKANILLEGEANTYPYTHPIRDLPDYVKVKVKK